MPKALELLNKKFNRLQVVSKASPLNGSVMWNCLCDCGNSIVARGANLVNNTTKSCGCLKNEMLAKAGESSRYQKTLDVYRQGKIIPSYYIWHSMMTRCYEPKYKKFHDYGGRGITVCDRWHEYKNFLADMGEPPEGLTIERTDNNGNYSPENCKWATDTEQGRNKRNNRLLTYKGETKCVTAWAEELDVNPKTLYTRVYLGWTDEQVLGTPLK